MTPCNVHIDRVVAWPPPLKALDAAGGKAVIFNTITVSDGISMGTEGMKYSLVSREVIADSIETVAGAEGFDGLVAIGGCDKNMPGLHHGHRPVRTARAVFVYGGTILPGELATGRTVDHRERSLRPSASTPPGSDQRRGSSNASLEQHAIPGCWIVRWHVHRQHHGQRH